jgi:hypothetical protein
MRVILKFLLGLILVLVIAWLGLWWYAQGRLQAGFQNWADTQATSGWKIADTGITRGNSPMQALITVSNLTLTPPPVSPSGETATITLPSFGMHIDALNPLVFHIDLPSDISVAAGPNVDFAIKTASIAITESLDPNALFNKTAYPFRGGDFSASNMDILASDGSLLVLHIDSITGHEDLNLGAGAAETALASTTSFTGLALSPLLTKVAQIPFNGQIQAFSTSVKLSGPVPADLSGLAVQFRTATDPAAQYKLLIPVVQKWASQGGTGAIGLGLTIGPSTAKLDANVKFDANVQPSGTANLSADHLDQFTGAITNAYPQVQDTVSQAEAQLTPYLTTTSAGGQTLGMAVTYGPPGITINGKKVADMPPVDWTALENPPPAPPPAPAAPGDGSGAASPTAPSTGQ